MNRWKFRDLAVACGVSLSLLVLSGCGGSATTSGGTTDGKPPEEKPTPAAKKETVKPGKAVIKGTVTFEGDEPDVTKINADLVKLINDKAAADKEHCLAEKAPAEDKEQQEWRINKTNKGLKNVVVFLLPEGNTFFANSADDEAVKAVKDKSLDIHQPYCEFHPHVSVLFPKYQDEKKKEQSTGQVVTIFNDTNMAAGGKAGGISHNTKWSGGSGQGEGNPLIPAGSKSEITNLKPDSTPVALQCSIHPWMNATIWVVNNPYYAVTDENGHYEIKNAPAGKVRIVAWHEKAAGEYLNKEGRKGEVIELKDGENKQDFKAKK